MTSTLETVSGIQTRIFTLPGRLPFMIAADLAEAYQTTPKRLGEAVKRNPARFPERYVFVLSEGEEAQMRSQFATTYGKKRHDLRPLVFTHGGANMLASVLRGPVADEMAVIINDAFTGMEARAIHDAKIALSKLTTEWLLKKPIRARLVAAWQAGMSIDEFKLSNPYYSYKLIEASVRELRLAGQIPSPLRGMSETLFDA